MAEKNVPSRGGRTDKAKRAAGSGGDSGNDDSQGRSFPIVGLGASAGGSRR